MAGRPKPRPCAAEAISCDEISSSSDSSDSSNDGHPSRFEFLAGSRFNPASDDSSRPPHGSDDSTSLPFEVNGLDEPVAAESGIKSKEDSSGPVVHSCFYGLSSNCLDQRACGNVIPDDILIPGLVQSFMDTCKTAAGFLQGNLNVGIVCGFKSWFLFTFMGMMLAGFLYTVQAPFNVCVILVLISSAYMLQHTLFFRKVTDTARETKLYNHAFQKFMGQYTSRSCVHNVLPCTHCQEQFVCRGIFDFHNRVASRLPKTHICNTPYSGYDYLVAYLVWGMDQAMVDMLGHGFMQAICEGMHSARAEGGEDVTYAHDSTKVYAASFLCGAATELRQRSNNRNNCNVNMDAPEPHAASVSEVATSDYDAIATASGSADSLNSSSLSMDYLAFSDDSTESEGYHTAINHNSPTTSMNVHFMSNSNAATNNTATDDYTAFSLYTEHSSMTDTPDFDEGEDDDEEEEVEIAVLSRSSSNASLDYGTASCNDSEAPQYGSENGATNSQCGSDVTKDETVAGKSEDGSQSGSREGQYSSSLRRQFGSHNIGDSSMVNQLIAESVREHLSISTGTGTGTGKQKTSQRRQPIGDSPAVIKPAADPACKKHTMLKQLPDVLDTMNTNNNGNALPRPTADADDDCCCCFDEEANIEGFSQMYEDMDVMDVNIAHAQCSVHEEDDVHITYSDSVVSLDSDEGIYSGNLTNGYTTSPREPSFDECGDKQCVNVANVREKDLNDGLDRGDVRKAGITADPAAIKQPVAPQYMENAYASLLLPPRPRPRLCVPATSFQQDDTSNTDDADADADPDPAAASTGQVVSLPLTNSDGWCMRLNAEDYRRIYGTSTATIKRHVYYGDSAGGEREEH